MAGSAAAALAHEPAAAALQCVTGSYPSFMPNRLTVDCASRQNFRLFRQNTAYLGLTGVVNMTFVRGKYGSYEAGNLFLFPWLKPKGRASGKLWRASLPTGPVQTLAVGPIPNWRLPLDEYLCRYCLEVPTSAFIGFRLDEPFGSDDARRAWFTNVDRLADRKEVGIAWTSSNLNHPWFGGSRWIPKDDTCNGAAWRKLIVDAVDQASVSAC